MPNDKDIDVILREVEGHKMSTMLHEQAADFTSPDQAPIAQAQERRTKQVEDFSLDFDADAVVADAQPDENPLDNEPVDTVEDDITPTQEPSEPALPKKKKRKFLGRLLYSFFVVLVSLAVAAGGIAYFFEASGMNGSDQTVDVEIPQGAYTAQIADILKDKGLINHTLFFRLYAKFAKADGLWQVGTFMLSSDMGYVGMVEELQTATPRENVNVTIPEGYTVEEIAKLLAEKDVCSETDFFNAVVNAEYDYDFIKAIPTAADGEQHAGRIYRLEGYLFPDTYNFFVGSSGDMVVKRMLENFNRKLTPEIRRQISEKGWNIDEAITFASIIQGEAGKPDDMYAVSKVLTNRLQPNSGFPKLQCDATRDYVREILPSIPGVEVTTSPYDTYVREGLPVGAINNPGLLAIEAALNPSTDEKYANCYYFATDYDTGITYYSMTLAQHEATCRKYKIGMYG